MAETAATTARLAAGAPAPRAGSVAVRRGAYYLLLTGVVGGAYLAAAVLFTVLQAREVTDSRAFPVFFTLAVLVLFNPLRTRLQAFIDRVFFRTRYDGAQVLAALGAPLHGGRRRVPARPRARGRDRTRERALVRGAGGAQRTPRGAGA